MYRYRCYIIGQSEPIERLQIRPSERYDRVLLTLDQSIERLGIVILFWMNYFSLALFELQIVSSIEL
jgi:hypothetical protein